MLSGSGFVLRSSGFSSPASGQRRGWRAEAEIRVRKIKMKKMEEGHREVKCSRCKEKAKLRDTEKGGGCGDRQGKADSAEWDADGSKTRSLRILFSPPV